METDVVTNLGLQVKIVRKSLADDFGFSVAEKFRIAGRAKVVGSVRNSSPASEYMKVGDELLTLMGEQVFDWELGEIKSALRNFGMVFEARIFRPNSLTPPKAPELTPKERQVSMVTGKKWFCVPTEVEEVNPIMVPNEVISSQRAYIRNGKKVKNPQHVSFIQPCAWVLGSAALPPTGLSTKCLCSIRHNAPLL